MFDPTRREETVNEILREKGVVYCNRNVNLRRDPDSGLLLVATNTIKSGQLILEGKMDCALELENTQHSIKQLSTEDLAPEGSIHCHFAVLLTLRLTREGNCFPWKVPDISHYQRSFPIFWPTNKRSLLDEDTKGCLKVQLSQLEGDWKYAQKICGLNSDFSKSLKSPTDPADITFLRAWFYIESKAYVDPRKPYIPWSTFTGPKDWQIVFPVVDHLPFGPEGCNVQIDGGLYKFKTTREYKDGESIDLQCQYDADLSLVTTGKIAHNISRDHEPLSSCGRLSPIKEEQSPIS